MIEIEGDKMREVTIGDFVETVYDVNGILIDVRNTPYGAPYGTTAYIATADGRTFYCPVSALKDCIYKE